MGPAFYNVPARPANTSQSLRGTPLPNACLCWLAPGAVVSPLFPGRTSAVHPEDVSSSRKTFHNLLHDIRYTTPFPLTVIPSVHLADQGLAPQTIKLYIAALCNAQICRDRHDPRDHSSMPLLTQEGSSRHQQDSPAEGFTQAAH